jgi:hypothetical protein
VYRYAQTLIIADFLTLGHQIILLHQGLTGGADVLRHGDDQNIRLGKILNGLVASVELIFRGMDTAEKRKRHVTSPLSKLADYDRIISTYMITYDNPFVHKFFGDLHKFQ